MTLSSVASSHKKSARKKLSPQPQNPPAWDLNDLYASYNSPKVDADLQEASRRAAAFQDAYRGKVASLGATALAGAIAEYEKLTDLLGRLGSYAYLLYAADASDAEVRRFYQNIHEQENAISTQLLFFTLEINALEDGWLRQALAGERKLAHYAPWLRQVRAFKPYVLPEAQETLLHEKSLVSRTAWERLFDETMNGLRVKLDGKKLSLEQVLDQMQSPKEKERKKAARELGKTLSKHADTLALVTNTLAKDKEIEDRWRQFPRPISSRNLSNDVEDKVVDALLQTVQRNYGNLSHRYYALKAKWLGHGKKPMPYWDRMAPLPGDDNRRYRWDEAVNMVLDAYAQFSPEFSAIGCQFFDNDWVDAALREGKAPGAFSHSTVPSAHPYIFMNYQGKLDDIMTLAHELGHGVHQVLAAEQGALMSDTPLTLAETASVFGEMMTFQYLLAREKDVAARRRLIAGKVEDMLGTVVRQVAFCEFERRVHDERREGEISPARLGEIWMDVSKASLGPSVKLGKEYQSYWSYIPHFIHSPFYVYAYAFGDCLVNSLFGVYQKGRGADGRNDAFVEKYFTLLKAGGTLHHRELLAPFGLDAGDGAFWQQGVDVIAGYIDELEGME